jgi:hypothetical protein
MIFASVRDRAAVVEKCSRRILKSMMRQDCMRHFKFEVVTRQRAGLAFAPLLLSQTNLVRSAIAMSLKERREMLRQFWDGRRIPFPSISMQMIP